MSSTPSHTPNYSTPIAWPRSLIIPIAITLVLLAFFTTLELPGYVHGPGVPRSTILIVLVSYATAIVTWMSVHARSKKFADVSIEQPAAWFRHQLRRLPLFLLCFIALGFGLRLLGFSLIGYGMPFSPPVMAGLLFYEVLKATLIYCCWLGLAFGVLSFVTMRRQNEHLLASQKALMEAKLMRLQGQLRPHFLFNTLNTISSLMQVDVTRADRLVTQLGDLLRANLNVSNRDIVPLAEELELLRQYAGIMQERFADRVSIEWKIDPNALGATVPTMMLQPLLENAFKHGVERSTVSERIKVRIDRKGALLAVAVHNSGSSMNEAYDEGWGLRNTRERLELLYGRLGLLELRNEVGGVIVEINIPYVEAGATIDIPLNVPTK